MYHFFAQAADGSSSGNGSFLLILMVASVAMIWFALVRPQRKQEQSHKSLMDSLKKNDRVYTIGGIVGVIHSVDKEKNEIVLKVDDGNNTKIKFLLSAIAGTFETGKTS